MAINRFSQPVQQSKYQPLSFQELAFAPMQMRAREDSMLNATDEMQALWANYKGADQYNEETQKHIQGLQDKAKGLVKKLQETGATDPGAMNELRAIRNEYNMLISENGALGKSAKVRESFDNAKTAFYKAAQEENWPQELIDKNWELAAQGYASKLPESLKDHTGSIPEFMTPYVPAKEDISDFYMKYHKMLGTVEKEHPGAKSAWITDENGVERWGMIDGKGKIIDNEDAVVALRELAKNTIYDPTSNIAQNLKFAGKNPEDELEKINMLSKMIYSSRGSGGGSPRQGGQGGYNPNQNGGSKSEVKLRKTTSGSSTLIAGPEQAAQRLREIDQMPESAQTDEIKSEKLALQQGIQTYLRAEQQPEFKQTMDAAFDNNDPAVRELQAYGINSWEEFQAKRDQLIKAQGFDPKKTSVYSIPRTKSGFNSKDNVASPLKAIDTMMEAIAPVYEKAVDMTGLRTNSESFVFSHGEAGKKLQKTLDERFGTRALESALVNNAISITEDRLSAPYAQIKGPDHETAEPFKELYAKYKEGEATLEFESITTGGLGQPPSLEYKLADKDGNVQHISFNLLRDKELANDILDPKGDFVLSLDAESQATMGAVRDKVIYAGLDTAILSSTRLESQYPNKRFVPEQTSNINKYAQIATKNLFGRTVTNTKKPVGVDKLMVDTAFFKPGGEEVNGKDVQYSVDVTEDGSYMASKRLPDGTVQHYTLGDHFERLAAKDYLVRKKGYYTDADYNKDGEQKARKLFAADYIENIMLGNVQDVTNPSESLLIFNDSAQFNQAFQQMYELRHKIQTARSEDQRNTYTLELYDVIESVSHLPMKSKRVEPILQ